MVSLEDKATSRKVREVSALSIQILFFIDDESSFAMNLNAADPFVSGDLEINNEGYNNKAVLEIMRDLPPFDWGVPFYNDGLIRIKRGILLLENGAKYEGEW